MNIKIDELANLEIYDSDDHINEDIVDLIIDTIQSSDNETMTKISETLGIKAYSDALEQAFIEVIGTVYVFCDEILSPKPSTNPPNRLKEIVDMLWNDQQDLSDKLRDYQNKISISLFVAKRIRQELLGAISSRRSVKLKHFINKYISEYTTYGEIAEKRGLAKEMLISSSHLGDLKKQFIDDASALLGTKPGDGEFEDLYINRLRNLLYNYQLFGEIVKLVQKITKANDDQTIDLGLAINIMPSTLSNLAKIGDEMLIILEKVIIPPKLDSLISSGNYDLILTPFRLKHLIDESSAKNVLDTISNDEMSDSDSGEDDFEEDYDSEPQKQADQAPIHDQPATASSSNTLSQQNNDSLDIV